MTVELIAERLVAVESMGLERGDHSPVEGGDGDVPSEMCLLEAVAWVAGEPWSDQPECVSPVLGIFGRRLNDILPDEKRQKLKLFIPLLPGTADDGLDETRSYLALDWLIRTYTPTWLDLAGLTAEAQALRDLRRIVDLVSAQAAGPVVRAGRDKAAARAAAGAARDAAEDAALDVAVAAAEDAALDVAVAAAVAAVAAARDVALAAVAVARDVALDVALDVAVAAVAAARAAMQPTVDLLQDSAIDLFARMITPEVAR